MKTYTKKIGKGKEIKQAMNFQKAKGIGWCDATWNPITGCLGPRGDGARCPYCYAHKLANGRLKSLYLSNPVVIAGDPNDPFAPRFWQGRLLEPINHKQAAKIFVCDMGELFGDWLHPYFIDLVFNAIKQCPQHTFQLLTKQPQNLPKFEYPDNCWVGVSVTHAKMMADAVSNLAVIEAGKRFISFEPLLEPIPVKGLINFLDWIILGGKSGKDPFYPPLKWIVDIEDTAKEAGIPVFEKSNLVPYPSPKFLRQEFPASLLASSNLDPQLRMTAKERSEFVD